MVVFFFTFHFSLLIFFRIFATSYEKSYIYFSGCFSAQRLCRTAK